MNDLFNVKNRKKLIIFGSIFFLIIVILCIISLIKQNSSNTDIIDNKHVSITVMYAPFTSTVELDGKVLKNNSKNTIEIGTHNLVVSLDGFETIETEITIDSDSYAIYGVLTANTESGKDIEATNTDYLNVQALIDEIADSEGEKFLEKYPIVNYLPVKKATYKLGFNTSESNEFTVTIKAELPYIDSAVQALNELKISAITYNVIIRDFTNPFVNFVDNNNTDIESFLFSGFPNLVFDIQGGQTVEDYYIVNIIYGDAADYSEVTYHAILKQSGSKWELVSSVYPFLTTKNSPDIPVYILKQANEYYPD